MKEVFRRWAILFALGYASGLIAAHAYRWLRPAVVETQCLWTDGPPQESEGPY